MRQLDETEVRGTFAENAVHLFKGAAGRLGIEEVHDRNDEGITALCQQKLRKHMWIAGPT